MSQSDQWSADGGDGMLRNQFDNGGMSSQNDNRAVIPIPMQRTSQEFFSPTQSNRGSLDSPMLGDPHLLGNQTRGHGPSLGSSPVVLDQTLVPIPELDPIQPQKTPPHLATNQELNTMQLQSLGQFGGHEEGMAVQRETEGCGLDDDKGKRRKKKSKPQDSAGFATSKDLRMALQDVIEEYSELAQLLETSCDETLAFPSPSFDRSLEHHMKKCLKKLRRANDTLDKTPSVFNTNVPIGLIRHISTNSGDHGSSRRDSSCVSSQTQNLDNTQKSWDTLGVGGGGDPRTWLDEVQASAAAENDAARGELLALQSLHDTFAKLLRLSDDCLGFTQPPVTTKIFDSTQQDIQDSIWSVSGTTGEPFPETCVTGPSQDTVLNGIGA